MFRFCYSAFVSGFWGDDGMVFSLFFRMVWFDDFLKYSSDDYRMNVYIFKTERIIYIYICVF